MKKYLINSNICNSCGNCLSECPTVAIDTNDKGEYVIDPTLCTGCGNCNDICPVDAIEEKEAFNTVGDFNTQFKNCSGFKSYTKKNSEYFVINEELSDMFSSSGAGNVDLTGYNNKKFTTSFPAWVDKFICSIEFDMIIVNGHHKKIKCTKNTHAQHTTKSNTIYGCLHCQDNDGIGWYMQFAFKEDISVGTEIDLSQYVYVIDYIGVYYNTWPADITGVSANDFKYLNGNYTLFKTIKPFDSMHEKKPVL